MKNKQSSAERRTKLIAVQIIFTPRCAAQTPQRKDKTKPAQKKTALMLPVSTPLALQLCLQKDPLQLPLQGGGDAVLRSCQTLPAAHGCDQLLQLHPGAWWGDDTRRQKTDSKLDCNEPERSRDEQSKQSFFQSSVFLLFALGGSWSLTGNQIMLRY